MSVQLLEFICEESEYIEDMHAFLRDYAVWKVEILIQDTDFQQLLEKSTMLRESYLPL
ncbi:hypothetical protein BJX70DRAFT_383694 [Aspergillus crustosus]